MSDKIYHFYLKLLKKHGKPVRFWPNWCAAKKSSRDQEIIALGAILTQHTSWRNADLALQNLKDAGLFSITAIAKLRNIRKLTKLIRPAGFFQSKPKRLQGFCKFVVEEYGNLINFGQEELKVAREKLLALYGIGPETADTILLYALGMPSFVIDEYTKRLVKRKKLAKRFDYNFLKGFFEASLPKSPALYRDFHALIIIDQKGEEDSKMKRW